MVWLLIGSLFLVSFSLVLIGIGAFNIRSGIFIKTLSHWPVEQAVLTFDDGPDPVFTPQILDLLKAYGVKAVFFCIGSKVQSYPELSKRIVEEGHTIGNHTLHHSFQFTFKSRGYVHEEITKTNQIIYEHTGVKCKWFRPPYGVTNPRIASIVNDLDMQIMGWSVRSLDTILRTPEKISHRVNKRVGQGDIILFHDNRAQTPPALKVVLDYCRGKNIELIK